MTEGGTGKKFTYATTVVAGVASLAATLLSIVYVPIRVTSARPGESQLTARVRSSIWLQAKNYRKPLLQRYVIRILLMVPIYSIASWTSMVSLTTAAFLDPVRDIYEAFTIYTFFQLLINYLSGERSLIIMTHGRAPVQHLWPMNHVLRRVDISDPHTFLSIKRGILQYAWLKPILALSAIIMKATGTYQEGYIGLSSGYFWSGIIYNISVTVSLYSLGLFWVCMHHDLQPFRPVPKFLCIKLIIFASYWQGFFLSVLVWLGAIPDDVEGYTRDNLAVAIQDALICIEMPIFAVAHWYAFSWHDFANNNILSARMPLNYALRDAFGIRDLIEDTKETFKGENYGYRTFDSGDKVMAHEDSKSRLARLREGMRYERGGKGKYWIPKPGEINSSSPLLGSSSEPGSSRPDQINDNTHGTFDEPELDGDEERMYDSARELEFGDWNVSNPETERFDSSADLAMTASRQYPVITASEPLATRYRASQVSLGARSQGSASRTAAEPQVVPVRKKKKVKKVVKHAEPNPSQLGLDRGPPAPQQAESSRGGEGRSGEAAPSAPQETRDESQPPDNQTPTYHLADNDEFRNVWDGRE
ncbi:hypothetical protein HIM_02627 [Hirsutella minnesotensis 3608]|nr:hypothetical protein HIM_02627 [Hirsutella minnesotensis 3608]